jgi:hypothetical protein
MEMSPTFEYRKSKIAYRMRPCNVLYAYQKHEELGFLYARIQTWLPFHIQIGINGREWLARQMDREKLSYQQHHNCFPWIEDFWAGARVDGPAVEDGLAEVVGQFWATTQSAA